MLYWMMTACLQDVVESDEVALNITVGVGDAVAHSSLGSEVDDYIYLVVGKQLLNEVLVGYAALDECPVFAEASQFFQTFVLEADIIIVGNGINANDLDGIEVLQQAFCQIATYKSGSACDEDSLAFQMDIVC